MRKYILIWLLFSSVVALGQTPMRMLTKKQGPPPPAWTEFTFTTTSTISQTANVWGCTAMIAGWDSHGLDAQSFSGDVKIRAHFISTAAQSANMIYGFNLSSIDENYTGIDYAAYVTTSGVLNWLSNGANASTGYTLAAGDYYGVRRIGTTVDVITSPDGSTWTSRYTFPATTSATLYVNLNIYQQPYTCEHPQWQ